MAFFDDLGKKITSVGQTAVQKTKDMTDIARINSSIAEEEKLVNNCYFQIGKLYVAKHLEDYEEEFAGLISNVVESENKISNYKKQIQETKGLVRCENCGAEVSNTLAFCSGCGAQMPRQENKILDENSIRCMSCGAIVPKTMRFCTSCGNQTGAQQFFGPQPGPQPGPAVPPMPPMPPMGQPPYQPYPYPNQPVAYPPQGNPNPYPNAPQPAPAPSGRKCTNCGAEIEDGVDFCTECGTRL